MSRNISLQAKWIGVGHASPSVLRSERRYRGGLVEPDKGVELLRQRCGGVMTHQLSIRPVNNSDEPFQPRLQQASPQRLVPAEIEQEARDIGIVAGALVAVAMRWPYALDLHVATPIRRRGHSAGVRAEADQCSLIAKSLT